MGKSEMHCGWKPSWGLAAAGALFTLGLAREAAAQAATTTGAITTAHPTLEHASIEWAISGDDDGGCGCRFGRSAHNASRGLPFVLLLLMAGRRRRRGGWQ